MRAVLVHLDAGLRLGLGVRVAADVRAPVDDENALVQLGRHALGNGQTEESGTDDEEVKTSGHRQPGYPTASPVPNPIRAQGRDSLTITYRHSRPISHTSTIVHVSAISATRSPHIEETSVPNRRRRRLSTAMSAVAALAVASPSAVIALSDLSKHQAATQHREFARPPWSPTCPTS